jgi:hypothetical protein
VEFADSPLPWRAHCVGAANTGPRSKERHVKIRTVIGLTGAAAASLVGTAALAASPAGAVPGQQIGAANLSEYLGVPGLPLFAQLVYPGEPGLPFPTHNVKVSGNCVTAAPWLFSDQLGFNFIGGNGHVYQLDGGTSLAPTFPGGANATGTAELVDFNNPDGSNPPDFLTPGQTYTGRAHVWLGQNGNAKGQLVGAETVTFSGTAPDGSTISIIANPGSTTSASGNQNGWGQENLSCNILSAG